MTTEERRAYNKQYYLKNKEKSAFQSRMWYEKNKKTYNNKNRERYYWKKQYSAVLAELINKIK